MRPDLQMKDFYREMNKQQNWKIQPRDEFAKYKTVHNKPAAITE